MAIDNGHSNANDAALDRPDGCGEAGWGLIESNRLDSQQQAADSALPVHT